MDYVEPLSLLSVHDERVAADIYGRASTPPAGVESSLDPRTLALVRLAALVVVGGAVPSFGAQTDAAVDGGANADEIAEVLVAIAPLVGLPRVVAAAPKRWRWVTTSTSPDGCMLVGPRRAHLYASTDPDIGTSGNWRRQ